MKKMILLLAVTAFVASPLLVPAAQAGQGKRHLAHKHHAKHHHLAKHHGKKHAA